MDTMSQSLPANLKVIGRYTILRELRRDRHSVSYAAVDPVMNRETGGQGRADHRGRAAAALGSAAPDRAGLRAPGASRRQAASSEHPDRVRPLAWATNTVTW